MSGRSDLRAGEQTSETLVQGVTGGHEQTRESQRGHEQTGESQGGREQTSAQVGVSGSVEVTSVQGVTGGHEQMTDHGPEDTSISTMIEKAIRECIASDRSNNPVEMLRHLQRLIVTGRPLDITDETQLLEEFGETNFIMIKRNEVLNTAFSELKECKTEELRKTLEVKFHAEVCPIPVLLLISFFFELVHPQVL